MGRLAGSVGGVCDSFDLGVVSLSPTLSVEITLKKYSLKCIILNKKGDYQTLKEKDRL